jgi:ribosomal protein S18 acetylase RimI-like enzyme
VVNALVARQPDGVNLHMDGIAVAPEARGRGIGTRLLEAVHAFAREQGYAGVRLDVIDRNPAARRLYERLGYIAVHTRAYPFLAFLGFTAVTTMIRPLHASGY